MTTAKPRAAREGDLGRLDEGRTGPAIQTSSNVKINHRRALRVGHSGLDSQRSGAKKWDAKSGAPRILINNQPAHRLLDIVQSAKDLGKTITSSIDTLFGNFTAKEGPTLHPISIVLYDMPGPLGAPLANTPYVLRCAGVEVARGTTDLTGKVEVPEEKSRYRVYDLVIPGHTTTIIVRDVDSQPDPAKAAARLSSLGYNPQLPSTMTADLISNLNLFEDDEESQGALIDGDDARRARLEAKAGF